MSHKKRKTRRVKKRNPFAAQLRSANNRQRVIGDKRFAPPKYKEQYDG